MITALNSLTPISIETLRRQAGVCLRMKSFFAETPVEPAPPSVLAKKSFSVRRSLPWRRVRNSSLLARRGVFESCWGQKS